MGTAYSTTNTTAIGAMKTFDVASSRTRRSTIWARVRRAVVPDRVTEGTWMAKWFTAFHYELGMW